MLKTFICKRKVVPFLCLTVYFLTNDHSNGSSRRILKVKNWSNKMSK